jgi:hypothetical protein
MTTAIPAWTKISAGEEQGTVSFALILDGVVQQIMKTNVATASLLLEGPQIVRCKDDAIAGQTAEEVAL